MNEASGHCTPTRSIKKKVSFADDAGLTLENVKTIPPYRSEDDLAFNNTTPNNNVCGLYMHSPRRWTKFLSPCFVEPCKTDSFMERVFKQNVCLESVSCNDLVVKGIIRVTNMDYVKQVTVRSTFDDWNNFRDIWTDYLSSNMDGKTEKFSFRITAPVDFEADFEVEFAIRYRVAEYEFWDNNFGRNYIIRCF